MSQDKSDRLVTRRQALARAIAGAAALVLAGCEKLSESTWFPKLLSGGEKANYAAQRALLTRKAMAQEFTEADLSPEFRSNGTSVPRNPAYLALSSNGFADYRLQLDGLIE